jgi:hypothetical protein
MALSRDMSALIAMVCEAFLYGSFSASTANKLIVHFSLGSYTILFAFSIYLKLNSSHRWNAANSPIFILGVLLFLACTTHFVLEFNHFYHALVCVMRYFTYAISRHSYYRIPLASRDLETRKMASSGPFSSSQSRISWVNLSSSTAAGCCGPRIM